MKDNFRTVAEIVLIMVGVGHYLILLATILS